MARQLLDSVISAPRTHTHSSRGRAASSRPTRAAQGRQGGELSPYGQDSAVELDTSAGLPSFSYAPERDGDADPGEVVWTWVPYEDVPQYGKDRPVLVLGRAGNEVVVAQLTSQDHDRDAADEARRGRYWMDIGTGDWDARRRPSEVRLDRLLRVSQKAVRREGGVLAADVFARVLDAIRDTHVQR